MLNPYLLLPVDCCSSFLSSGLLSFSKASFCSTAFLCRSGSLTFSLKLLIDFSVFGFDTEIPARLISFLIILRSFAICRSEERRVGKGCRCRSWGHREKKKRDR